METSTMDRPHKPQLKTLSPQDAEIVDALLDPPETTGLTGSDTAALSLDQRSEQVVEKYGERGRRVIAWLQSIGHWPSEEPADNLDQRVTDSLANTTVLDALLDSGSGMSHEQVMATFGDKATRVSHLLDMIGYLPADAPADDLVQRTIARIENATAREREIVGVIQHVEAQRPAATGTGSASSAAVAMSHGDTPIAFRWRELIAVAAMLLIGFSLLFPVMNRTRSDAMRVRCASHLGASYMAIGSYHADHDSLPRYDVQVGAKWWNVGQPVRNGVVESNSAHLFLLPRNQYLANTKNLGCPSNPDAPKVAATAFDWPNARAVSYSYQNQYTHQPIQMGLVNDVALLADKNPLFTPTADGFSLMFNEKHDASKSGHRHNNPGQMVLLIDGRVQWTQTPMIGGDNIYTAQGIENYTGTESPTNLRDTFLVP